MKSKGNPLNLTPADIARFESKVDKSSGEDACWLYTAALFKGTNYGAFAVNRKNKGAHCVAWVIANGEIPAGFVICHKCDNPPCVNPAHLFIGTEKDNMRDCQMKGRVATGDKHGSCTHPERVPRGERNSWRKYPEKIVMGDQHWTRKNPELVSRGEAHYSRQRPEVLARGERNGSAKLTESEVIEILRLRKCGLSLGQIASNFSMAKCTIGAICSGRIWAHIPRG